MKFTISNSSLGGRAVSPLTAADGAHGVMRPTGQFAFTMMEIAICLAIISFALVAIIGVLPLGMNTQRDNREGTVINQDATVLLEAIRNGSQNANDLTSYVYAVVDEGAGVGYLNQPLANKVNFSGPASFPNVTNWNTQLTSGKRIIGLLSTPGGNHMVALVNSMSGLAAEQPPQDNAIIQSDTFGYRVVCVNVPIQGANNALQKNLWELRMTFLWPQLPNGSYGNGRQTYRTTIAGRLTEISTNPPLYFYLPQTYSP